MSGNIHSVGRAVQKVDAVFRSFPVLNSIFFSEDIEVVSVGVWCESSVLLLIVGF